MEKERIVGKQALETLTTGMYADSRVIFREYIQNSADAIDKAVADGILKSRDDGRVDVTINPKRREIRIRDNGIGISLQEVYHELGDIGKSQKLHTENRGFRGIGRLGGLAYCKELQFITSFRGEDRKTITVWDCVELRRYLQPDIGREMSIIKVVDAVTKHADEPEDVDAHYFEVVLIGIEKEHDNLLEIDDVQNYLSQVAPVPFNAQNYAELPKINQKLREFGKEPEEFNICLNKEQIYKLYKRSVSAGEKNSDFIKSIEFFESRKEDNSLYFLGWYGMTDLSGVIKDDNVNGLRVRKGNILIGNNRTLDEFFAGNTQTNGRFNRYFVGEIYVFDDNLIPNGRRDDFEKNSAYFRFKKEVEVTATELRKLAYDYSKARSTEKAARANEELVREATKQVQEIKKEIATQGLTETKKKQLVEKLGNSEQELEEIDIPRQPKVQLPIQQDTGSIIPPSKKDEDILKERDHALKETRQLKDRIQRVKEPLAPVIPVSKEVENAINRIFEVIERKLDEGLAKELKAAIIEELQIKPKDGKK